MWRALAAPNKSRMGLMQNLYVKESNSTHAVEIAKLILPEKQRKKQRIKQIRTSFRI